MSENSKIEWTDHTFNPWIGCTKVSPACDHCYAERSTPSRTLGVVWGPHAKRRRTGAANWALPKRWNDQQFYECTCCGWRGNANDPEFKTPKKGCIHDLVPTRARVFCASLADVFDNAVPAEWRADLFRLIRATPNLDWLLLTKRIGNAHEMMVDTIEHELDIGAGHRFDQLPWPNIWLGATICNQEEAERDIPKLQDTPAAVRFLSIEPMLGPVFLGKDGRGSFRALARTSPDSDWTYNDHPLEGKRSTKCGEYPVPRIDWVIVGAESGPGARAAQLPWIRSLVHQCQAARVPVFVKQLGRVVLDDGMASPGQHWPAPTVRQHSPRLTEGDPGFFVRLRDAKGGDWSEWPEDLCVREFPQ